jgi:hypothetical protein
MRHVTDPLIAVWTERLRIEIPDVIAVVLKGSHVTGAAGPHSDIDFDVLVSAGAADDHHIWLEETDGGRLRHISAGGVHLERWLAGADEPEEWAYGLPVHEPTHLLWAATDALRARLDRPYLPHPPAEPEIEDAIESLGKMRNALARSDETGLRQAAQALARYVPTTLRPLNPAVVATSPRSALDAVLAFPVAPNGYREDMLACLGMTPAVPVSELVDAGTNLLSGTLALAAERADVVAPLLATDLAGYLRDGTLARYVRQIAGDPGHGRATGRRDH